MFMFPNLSVDPDIEKALKNVLQLLRGYIYFRFVKLILKILCNIAVIPFEMTIM